MARIEALPAKAWPREMREALTVLVPPTDRQPKHVQAARPKGLNAFGTLAHHPQLARACFAFNSHLLLGTTLSPRHRELVILRVAAVRGASYEWAQHVLPARDAGLTDDEMRRVGDGADPEKWSALEAALLSACDELLADGMIDHPTWATLFAEMDTQQLMDLVFTVGAYETLALFFRSFAVDLDDDLKDV